MLVQYMNLKNGKVFTSKYVGTGPSSYDERVYGAAVSQRLRNTDIENRMVEWLWIVDSLVRYRNGSWPI